MEEGSQFLCTVYLLEYIPILKRGLGQFNKQIEILLFCQFICTYGFWYYNYVQNVYIYCKN